MCTFGEGLLPRAAPGASSRWRRGSAAVLPPTERLAVYSGCSREALWPSSPALQCLLQGLGVREKVLTGGGSADCGSPTCPLMPEASFALEAGVRAPGGPCPDLEHPGLGFCFVCQLSFPAREISPQKLQRQHFSPILFSGALVTGPLVSFHRKETSALMTESSILVYDT